MREAVCDPHCPLAGKDKLDGSSEQSRCALGVLVFGGHPNKGPQTGWWGPRVSVLLQLWSRVGDRVSLGPAPPAAAREGPSCLSGSRWPRSPGGPRSSVLGS